ncbi:MAG: SH3 domain-containing protein [Candidatus Omnitrophica bacterium]|nr:SH3 domain-containing protein [Candidatus Omnitrophota bacterium]
MKTGKRILFFVIFMLLIVSFFTRADAKESYALQKLFFEGNGYYENGEYAGAAAAYEKIIDKGYANGAVCYNLAGAYFKAGDLGRAILNYERAKYFMPRSADLTQNYKFARRKMKRTVSPRKEMWFWKPLRLYSSFFTVRELMWIASGEYFLILIVIAAGVVFPKIRRHRLIPVIVLIAGILFTSFCIAVKTKEASTAAVVMVPETFAFFGPFDSATKFFTLYEGMPVEVLKSKDDWYKVKRQDGKSGWIKKDKIQFIRN